MIKFINFDTIMTESNDTGRDFILQYKNCKGPIKAPERVCLQKGTGRNMQKITNNR